MNRKIMFWVTIISLGWCVSSSLLLSYLVIISALNGWNSVSVNFNGYHEGIVELILYPLFGLVGFAGLIWLGRFFKDKYIDKDGK